MNNILLMKKSTELEKLSLDLGFDSTIFCTNIVAKNPKELLSALRKTKGLKVYKVSSEEMLRFALEKTSVDVIFGMELVNPRDHTHYARGGLDQIVCRIAASKGKTFGFSFSSILNSRNRAKLLGRMMLNLKLCKKYGVKVVFGNFSLIKSEMRSLKDLEAFKRLLG
jgi:RNase P/RNase MRP subunit p30